MPRSTRLFDIIQILRAAKDPVTAQSLAEELEVTKRTIYRDVASLQAMRVPVAGEAGIGYIMRPGFDLPPLAFTAEELEALSVGITLLHRTGDRGLERAARRAGEKIASAMSDTPDTITLQASGWHRVPTGGVKPEELRGHIRKSSELRIVYCDAEGAQTERLIKPVALIYYIDATLVAAWCGLRQDFRHFRLDRIVECLATGVSFLKIAADLRDAWQATQNSLDRTSRS